MVQKRLREFLYKQLWDIEVTRGEIHAPCHGEAWPSGYSAYIPGKGRLLNVRVRQRHHPGSRREHSVSLRDAPHSQFSILAKRIWTPQPSNPLSSIPD